MNDLLNRVKGWIKFSAFEKLTTAAPDEITTYVHAMFYEANNRRIQHSLPMRDIGLIEGYDVRWITPFDPYVDPFVDFDTLSLTNIDTGYISSTNTYVALFQYESGEAGGLYLPVLDEENTHLWK
ncbi:hypothetical protein [Desertibacillus haloalkaliphilus]|uniref:hypothetical protein n=1 Tax=Desertibacillus haloalkaliphilus TaxID=1328930 RepID=UPI001C274C0C|nr:hypothetical protein [Desertibacillus haloalkaliphilus]MBU8906219.1 hypothetical protein [Desertibacillus haloalkaliphilus]